MKNLCFRINAWIIILISNTSFAVFHPLGLLDPQGLQIYAISLWQLGENNLALSVSRDLAASISTMEKASRATSVSFICKFLYKISGRESAIKSILKMPTELFQNSKISFVVAAIHALDESNRLESVVSSSRYFLESHEEIARMFCLLALGKLVRLPFLIV